MLSQHEWIYLILLLCAAVVFSNGLHYVLFRLVGRTQTAQQRQDLGIHRYLTAPARAVLLTIGLLIVVPLVPAIPSRISDSIEEWGGVLLVLFLGWLAVGGVYVFQAMMFLRFDISQADNLRARRIHTQIQFFRRMLIALVMVLDAAAVLWSLHNPQLWKFGTGLLASAGLASLVLATAARSTASNLLAGMQIALTEPIRIDDVVVIAGEWGRIAEITSTYVVVNIWDQRTLIVPLSFFIEQPFTNWTRSGAAIMGTAFLYVDYSVPVEPLRAELERIVKTTPLWDGRVCGLQVTNLSERTVELRCLVSSGDSGRNFDLRCLVREKMIAFVRDNYPHALPTTRVELQKLEEEATLPPQDGKSRGKARA
ncbi:MAG TPA: mechanosensitive ion channel domain-containing protein [Terracidiphilus sp.]|nr:mechanosensitive ion channel domain-containing protein [Terracidiphilus sp.]